MCVFPLFIDVALLGVIFVFLVSGFSLEFLVPDHHQTWASAIMSRPLTKFKKEMRLEVVLTAPVVGPRASDRWF